MIKVLLVDDQTLLRAGIRAVLENADDIQVVGEADNGRDGITAARRLRPDVVLMDLQMPVMTGTEATKLIRADPQLSSMPVLVLTTFDDEDDVVEAVAAGANGYILKAIEAEAFREAVRKTAQGGTSVAPTVVRQMMDRLARRPTRRIRQEQLGGLTPREVEILTHVGMGMSNEEIGAALYLSPETARTYVSRLLSKLNARDRSQLVVLAHRSGLVD